MQILLIVFLFICSLFIAQPVSAANYYVSDTGSNAGGASWSTAWNALSQINWSIIQPGDTIYLSGGSTGTTYAGGTTVSKSGTANAYVTIDSGANSPEPAGHNGPVIIEGGVNCLLITGSYVKLKNVICQHATNSGIRIQGTGGILENNTIRETSGQGIHVHYCTGCTVRGNRITTFPNDGPGENHPFQTDGIVAYDSTDTVIEHNWVKLTNQYDAAHIDGIQASTTLGNTNKNITIRYNYIENTKMSTSNAQGIYVTQMQGDVKIIGNIVILPIGGQAVASRLLNSLPVNVYLIGNTIKNGGYWVARVEDDAPVIKNNIFWQTGGSDAYIKNGALVRLDGWQNTATNINHNLYYAPYAASSIYSFSISGSGRSWDAWKQAGYDPNSPFSANPNLDTCLRPVGATHAAIGTGEILDSAYSLALPASVCSPDGPDSFLPAALTGRGTSWDIGAYEAGGTSNPTATPTTTPTTIPTGIHTVTPTVTSAVTLTVTPTTVVSNGDANGDGKVNGLDYVIWLNHYGMSNQNVSGGDFNSDTKVDDLDYQIWANHYPPFSM